VTRALSFCVLVVLCPPRSSLAWHPIPTLGARAGQDAYHVVELDEACRAQQLGEGWFPTMDDVPTQVKHTRARSDRVAARAATTPGSLAPPPTTDQPPRTDVVSDRVCAGHLHVDAVDPEAEAPRRHMPRRAQGGGGAGMAAAASFLAAILTEIYLCNACSGPEIFRRNGRGQGAVSGPLSPSNPAAYLRE
jgi:hypothetical protein